MQPLNSIMFRRTAELNREKKSMLAAGLAYSIFGLSYLFSKKALNVTEPAILLSCRFLVTLLVLNILALTGIMKLRLKGKKLLGPIMLGVLQPVLYFIFENYGLKYTTTSFTGIISSMSPVFGAILGVIILKEKPNIKQWVCIFISIAGVLMVSLGTSSGENTIAGCLCLLAAYFVGALYSIIVRKLSEDYSSFELTYIMFTVGFIFFAAMSLVTYKGEAIRMAYDALSHSDFIISILYLGGVASVGAYMLVNYSLSSLTVTRSTVFSSFATIVSVLSGVIIMKDPFTAVSAVAFVFILAGVAGVNMFAKKE